MLYSNPPTSLTSLAAIETSISFISNCISVCAVAAKFPFAGPSSAKNMPWWSSHLCALRTSTRVHFRSWSKNKSKSNEIIYRRSKAAYQRAIRSAKAKSWEVFRSEATAGDTFKALAKFSGKAKSIQLPSSMMINGSLSSDPNIIIDGCAKHFFPEESSTSQLHRDVLEKADIALNTTRSGCPSVSDWEFEAAHLS